MSRSQRPPTPPSDRPGRHALPDRRLASLYVKRSNTAPVKATTVGILSTYTPTVCGLASFANALRLALINDRPDVIVNIVRISAEGMASQASEVIHELSASDGAGVDLAVNDKAAAAKLNKCDVAVIQHDFDVFGGPDGDQVLRIMNWVRVPTVVVTHSVPGSPTDREHEVLSALMESADAVVAMSAAGRERLITQFKVPPRKTVVIPHGAESASPATQVETWPKQRPIILTWGLLRPGKGIELGMAALARLTSLQPQPRYIVAGPTHPKVLAQQGESYRESLSQQARELGVADLVEFEDGFLSPNRLRELIQQADVVLIPYESADRVTSAVLVEAMAAQKPVVATSFPHARELLAGDQGGLLAAQGDAAGLANALTRILTEPELSAKLVAQASVLTQMVAWPQVASHYRQLFDALLRRPNAPS